MNTAISYTALALVFTKYNLQSFGLPLLLYLPLIL